MPSRSVQSVPPKDVGALTPRSPVSTVGGCEHVTCATRVFGLGLDEAGPTEGWVALPHPAMPHTAAPAPASKSARRVTAARVREALAPAGSRADSLPLR